MEQLPSMIREYQRKYVVFKGDKHLQFWDSYASALQEGYEKFGLGAFLVKQVVYDRPHFIGSFAI